jgi:SAM-dependent methyltransferase
VAAGIPCLGIEPTAGTARAARALGIEVAEEFFTAELGRALAAAGRGADLVIGNNVYAHVPAINDFTRGMKAVLKPGGTITLEFPHLLRMIAGRQFDTVYHEHFSYLSLAAAARIFAAAGLRIFDVEKIPTHGGSLRIYGCHGDDPRAETAAFRAAIAEEEAAGLSDPGTYRAFQAEAARIKNDFVAYLVEARRRGLRVAGYGAAAKGNTLLNYAGVKVDLLPCIYDAAASKQGRFTPGSRIPILAPARIAQDRPDVIVVFPWNIIGEVREQLAFAGAWGARLVTAVPQLKEEAL